MCQLSCCAPLLSVANKTCLLCIAWHSPVPGGGLSGQSRTGQGEGEGGPPVLSPGHLGLSPCLSLLPVSDAHTKAWHVRSQGPARSQAAPLPTSLVLNPCPERQANTCFPTAPSPLGSTPCPWLIGVTSLKDGQKGDFLVVQWLRLHAPSAGGPGSMPG